MCKKDGCPCVNINFSLWPEEKKNQLLRDPIYAGGVEKDNVCLLARTDPLPCFESFEYCWE